MMLHSSVSWCILFVQLWFHASIECGSDHLDILLTTDSRQLKPGPVTNKLLETIFETVNRIDILNGATVSTPDRELLQYLLDRRTVRWYEANSLDLCSLNDGGEKCYMPDTRNNRAVQVRQYWEENWNGGYLIYGDLSDLSKYACLFDPSGTYLLVVNLALQLHDEQWRHLLELSLRSIWLQRGAFRVFVRLDDVVYTYDPFRRTESSEYGALVELVPGVHLPAVPVKDFAGYPIRIEVFRSAYSSPVDQPQSGRSHPTGQVVVYRGVDVTARDVLCRVLNITVTHIPEDGDLFGDRLPNGSFSGALGRVIRHEVDIVFTGFFIKDYFTREIEFTAGLYSDAVCCLVQKASRIPEALLPLYIFPGEIWALLCLLGIFCACVWCGLRWTVRRLQPTTGLWSRRHRLAVLFNLPSSLRREGSVRQVIQLYVDTFILLMSAPYQRFTRSGVERLFLTGLLLVSLIFVSLYQSGLSSVFVNPVYYPDIDTLQQLDESGMAIPVKYRGFIDDVFAVNFSRLMDALRGRMHHLQVKESMLARVARLGDIATVTRQTSLALDNAIYMTTRQLHMIPECPRTYNLAYVMPRRSVFGERFNKVLLRLVGGGLIDHWIDGARYEWTLRNWRIVQGMMESNYKVLTVLDMQFAFYTLAIGLVISTGAIGIELLYHHRTHVLLAKGATETPKLRAILNEIQL